MGFGLEQWGGIWNYQKTEMDEEGTVVYFKTSPVLGELGGGEQGLAGDIEEQEMVFSEPDPFQSDYASPTDSESAQISTTLHRNSLWPSRNALVAGLLGLTMEETNCEPTRKKMVAAVLDSPLLTEEDYQLLHFALPKASMATVPDSPAPVPDSPAALEEDRWRVLVAAAAVAGLAAVAAALLAGGVFQLAAVVMIFAFAVMAFLLLTKIVRYWFERTSRAADCCLATVLTGMDALLSLLTHTLRTIQEIEVLSRGYDRPLRVPVARLESGGGHYRCVMLRRRVMQTCQDSLSVLRGLTRQLCRNYLLNEELDARHGYLAFTAIEDLHSHIILPEASAIWGEDDVGDETRAECTGDETGYEKLPSLSLTSLKDACSLLAVQNSELLRRLALNLARSSSSPRHERLPLSALPGLLAELLQVTASCQARLTWSMDFHQNQFLGAPPRRREPAELVPGHGSALREVAEEVHCMDLKAQATLKRIRDVGLWLVNLPESERPDGTESVGVALDELREELCCIEQCAEGVADLAEQSMKLIDELEKERRGNNEDKVTARVSDDDGSGEAVPPDSISAVAPEENSDLSDEEMVFEGCVPAHGGDGSDADTITVLLTGEERLELEKRAREIKEVPHKVLTELRAVLTVRGLARERRREERRRRRRRRDGSVPADPPSTPPASSTVCNAGQRSAEGGEHCLLQAIKPTGESDVETVDSRRTRANETVVLCTGEEEGRDVADTQSRSNSCDQPRCSASPQACPVKSLSEDKAVEQLQVGPEALPRPLGSFSVVQAAAAAAATAARLAAHRQTLVFGDGEDTSEDGDSDG